MIRWVFRLLLLDLLFEVLRPAVRMVATLAMLVSAALLGYFLAAAHPAGY